MEKNSADIKGENAEWEGRTDSLNVDLGAIYTPEAKQSQSLGGLGGCGDTLFFINLPATWVQCQLNIKPQQIKTSSV